jgi:hypothetical protein
LLATHDLHFLVFRRSHCKRGVPFTQPHARRCAVPIKIVRLLCDPVGQDRQIAVDEFFSIKNKLHPGIKF